MTTSTQITPNSDSIMSALAATIPGDQAWITSAAASSVVWSGTFAWLMAEQRLSYLKNPESIAKAEQSQTRACGLIASVEHLLTAKMLPDYTAILASQLASNPDQRALTDEENIKLNAELLGTTVEEEETAAQRILADKGTPDAKRRAEMLTRLDQLANKLEHGVAAEGARELSPMELMKLTNALYTQLVGDPKRSKVGAITRAEDECRKWILPAMKAKAAGNVRLLKDAADQVNSISEVVMRMIEEQERAGYDVTEGGVH